MGDRRCILVKADDVDTGVFLYTHWHGETLPLTLQAALKKRWRWTDESYLTRIIFDQMTGGSQEETGYGISTTETSCDHALLTVNVTRQEVACGARTWSFEEYLTLPPKKLMAACP